MLTHHTRLTGIWGAGVPRWILLQHSVGHQTTGHQSRWSITFNSFQAPGYSLLPVRDKRQRVKVSSCSAELVFMKLFRRLNVKTKCSEPWRYLFIPKSFVTAPSKYFFNSETEYQNRKHKFSIMIMSKVTNYLFYTELLCVVRTNAHPWEGQPEVWHLCLKDSWPRWSHPRRSHSENWMRRQSHKPAIKMNLITSLNS